MLSKQSREVENNQVLGTCIFRMPTTPQKNGSTLGRIPSINFGIQFRATAFVEVDLYPSDYSSTKLQQENSTTSTPIPSIKRLITQTGAISGMFFWKLGAWKESR